MGYIEKEASVKYWKYRRKYQKLAAVKEMQQYSCKSPENRKSMSLPAAITPKPWGKSVERFDNLVYYQKLTRFLLEFTMSNTKGRNDR